MKVFIPFAINLYFHGRAIFFFFSPSAGTLVCSRLRDVASRMSLKPYTVSIVCLIICKIVTKNPGSDFFCEMPYYDFPFHAEG